MIRHRLADLSNAMEHAIEVVRVAKPMEAVAPAVLELLGRAAGSERASYWMSDPEMLRLRAIATWSALTPSAPAAERDTGNRTAPMSQGNAGHVWRSRKPLWWTGLMLVTTPRLALQPGLRGGVWFAVKTDTSVYGVIELLGRALDPKTPDNLMLLERLGFRLGYALEELRHGKARLH